MSIDILKKAAQHGTHNGIEWAIRPINAYRLALNAPKDARIYNGYARIPETSPLFGLITAGGIENTIGWDITYVGDDGWIGFDTAHAWDVWDFDPLYKATPGVEPDTGMFTPRYWNVGKVVEEAKGLCDRIREAETTLQAQR